MNDYIADFFVTSNKPRNKIEKWMFFDFDYSPEQIADLWYMTVVDLRKVFQDPYNNLTPRMIHDIHTLTGKSKKDILAACWVKGSKVSSVHDMHVMRGW